MKNIENTIKNRDLQFKPRKITEGGMMNLTKLYIVCQHY